MIIRGRIAKVVVAFGVTLAFTVACREASDDHVQKLTVVVREGLEAEGLRRVAEEWGRIRQVDVAVQALGRSNYEVVVKRDLLASKPAYDVVFFPGTHVAEMASKQAVAPITNWSPKEDPDLLTYSSYGGVVYGLPCDISTFFTFYRADVVEHVPETWAELLEAGTAWATRTNPASPTTYGFAFAAEAGEELPKIFYPLLWSYGGFILENGVIGVDSPQAIAAASMLRNLATSPAAPEEIATWNVIRILDELQAGTVAVSTPQWNALFPLLVDSSQPAAKNTKIAPIPGVRQPDGSVRRVNFKHTWVLVKPARGQRTQLANDFILYATGRDGAKLYALTARGNPARRSILSDPKLQKERPEFPLLLESVSIARAEPEVPYYSELHNAMNTALSSIVSGSLGPQQALQAAAKRLQELKATPEKR